MIKKVEGGWIILSKKNKKIAGPYKNRSEAVRRLKQIEYFKHKK